MIVRFLTAIISVIGGIYGYKSLLAYNLEEAKQFVLASSINAGILVLIAAILSINKQKFLKGNRGVIQLLLASFLSILIFLLVTIIYVYTNQSFLFLLLMFLLAQLFFVLNFRCGVFNQYMNIDFYWRIQLCAAITRLILLILISYISFISAINLVVIFVFISFLVAWLNTNGKILNELKYIFSNSYFILKFIRSPRIIQNIYPKIINGIFRSNRAFVETGLIPIYASSFLHESKTSMILLFTPFITASNNFFRTIFYKLDLRAQLPKWISIILLVFFIILSYNDTLSSLISGKSLALFFEESIEDDLMQILFLYFILLLPTIGYAQIEIFSSRLLTLFYTIFSVILCCSLIVMNWINAEYEYYFYIVPFVISFSLNVYKKLQFN